MAKKISLSDEIAIRSRSLDFSFNGMLLPNPDTVLRAQGQHIRVYRDLRVDAHVGGCIRRRKSAVKKLQWGLDRGRAPSRVHKSVEQLLADLPMDRIIGEALDAVFYGYQPMEVMWGAVGSLWVPDDVQGKPPEWFGFDSDNALRFRTQENMMLGELLPERKFLLPRQDPTYQNPYGFADLSMCFWPIVFKKGGMKFWLAFVEKFGSAFPVGKLPRTALAPARAEMLDSLETLIQDGVAVIPDDGSVELLEMAGKSASADLYERLVMFCRSEVSIGLTGTNQTTEATANKASAGAGLEVAAELRDGDAEIVAATINELIRWVVDYNWAGAEAPVFSFWDQESLDRLQAGRDKSNYDAGARFTNRYWMRTYGYQEGDLAPDAVAPAVPAAGGDGAGVNPAFADVQPGDPTPVSRLALQLAEQGGPAWAKVLEKVKSVVATADSLPALDAALLASFAELPTDQLTTVMAAAYAVADLAGQFDVREG
jgi:phage gp29-like protein